MLIFLIIAAVLGDGSTYQREVQFYDLSSCEEVREQFDIFMAMLPPGTWITYKSGCEVDHDGGEFSKQET